MRKFKILGSSFIASSTREGHDEGLRISESFGQVRRRVRQTVADLPRLGRNMPGNLAMVSAMLDTAGGFDRGFEPLMKD
jgi:hypothetical protein